VAVSSTNRTNPFRPLSPSELEAAVAALREGRPGAVTGPFQELIGYQVCHSHDHGIHLVLEVEEKHCSQYGIAHGGVTLALLDTAGGMACFFRTPGLARIATISLATSFVRGVGRGRVVATARIDHLGGAVAHVGMSLRAQDFGGPLLATATGAYRLFRARSAAL
jgi:uncharacterized protein (TIGR00369 family)